MICSVGTVAIADEKREIETEKGSDSMVTPVGVDGVVFIGVSVLVR